ncbi:MAG: M15 family metallopeptidase [Patescibacteria group bacterium]
MKNIRRLKKSSIIYVLLLLALILIIREARPVYAEKDRCGQFSYTAKNGRHEVTCQNDLCSVEGASPKNCECDNNYCCVEYETGRLVSLECVSSAGASTGTENGQGSEVVFEPQIPLPDFAGGTVSGSQFGEYLKAFYRYFSGVVGILAAAMIVFGGYQWITAAGNASRIQNAKTTISGALVGLVLTLTAYIFLNTINPELVQFKSIEPGEIARNALESTQTQECPTDTELVELKAYFPNNDLLRVAASVSDPRVRNVMIPKLEKAAKELKQNDMKLVITGAHRTFATQQRLFACYQEYNNTYSCDLTKCPEKCNEAAAPSCDAPHLTGMAIDACVEVGTDTTLCTMMSTKPINNNHPTDTNLKNSQIKFQEIMQYNGFYRYCGEWWHFEAAEMSASCDPGEYSY